MWRQVHRCALAGFELHAHAQRLPVGLVCCTQTRRVGCTGRAHPRNASVPQTYPPAVRIYTHTVAVQPRLVQPPRAQVCILMLSKLSKPPFQWPAVSSLPKPHLFLPLAPGFRNLLPCRYGTVGVPAEQDDTWYYHVVAAARSTVAELQVFRSANKAVSLLPRILQRDLIVPRRTAGTVAEQRTRFARRVARRGAGSGWHPLTFDRTVAHYRFRLPGEGCRVSGLTAIFLWRSAAALARCRRLLVLHFPLNRLSAHGCRFGRFRSGGDKRVVR
jgi:hypothetical protein